MDDKRLRVAVQKSGRLAEKSFDVLKRCGLRFAPGRNELFLRAGNMPVDLLRVRDDDIPGFVASGSCDWGVVGRNVFDEYLCHANGDGPPEIVAELGFSRCMLQIATPEGFEYRSPRDLQDKRIATSYPGVLKTFLSESGVSARVISMSGAVEIAPRLDLADAICDIVATGATLEANGLAAVETVLKSEALLIRSPRSFSNEKQEVAARLLPRMRGVLASVETKYVMMNAPRDAVDLITDILPGAEAPTVMPLAGGDAVAIHAVCRESVFWETLEKLKRAGASAILVLPIEKMMA